MKPKHGKRQLAPHEIDIVLEQLQRARDGVRGLEDEKADIKAQEKVLKGVIEALVSMLADGVDETAQLDLVEYIERMGRINQ